MLFAQQGYGKGSKIDVGLAGGFLDGVVVSPRDESRASVEALVGQYRAAGADVVLFDPQFYASTIPDPNARYLVDYEYFRPNLVYRNFITPSDITAYVDGALGFQARLQVTHFCSPTVNFAGFGDRWNPIALTMAAESVRVKRAMNDQRPLLVSFVIDEQAMMADEGVDEFLDIITGIEAEGYYFLIRRSENQYSQQMEPKSLANLMYLTYVLGSVNSYQVVFGHTDLIGALLCAAGATASANGWFNNLRYFSFARFEPSAGGRQPSPRYTSRALLNSIKVTPELDQIASVGQIRNVISGTSYDGVLNVPRPGRAPWPAEDSALHHWQVNKTLLDDISRRRTVGSRLDYVASLVRDASALYSNLVRSGVVFDALTGPHHLPQWHSAISDFRTKARL